MFSISEEFNRAARALTWLIAFVVAFVFVVDINGQTGRSMDGKNSKKMTITRKPERATTKGADATFTGNMNVEALFPVNPPSRVSGGSVMFQPGARSAWHMHPLGQILIVTAGKGWIQQEGGEKHEITPGDVVWTPPGVKHWHGATSSTAVTHIAIQETLNGKVVDWLQKVSDEEYTAGAK